MGASNKERVIRVAAAKGRAYVKWSEHALKRARQRALDIADVTAALAGVEVIEDYPTSAGGAPDCLCLCQVTGEPVHAVIAILDSERVLVVTVYHPDVEEWSDDFRKRL
ncbi:MAG: DUF4258 domain-containing protein [Anaerolineae bacterium]|nr:DUF4258 domain-containing protein [Anaerolineae bacterium]